MDEPTYNLTGTDVFTVIVERLTNLVENEAQLSGRPVDELWAHIELTAGRAQVSVDSEG